MATTNILHLSDLHFGDDRDKTGRQTRAEVLNGLIKIVTKLNPNLLVISGDLTFQGREQGYTELADWLTNFPDGDTPEGVSDMLGNVWEWTSSEFGTGRYSGRGASFLEGATGYLRAAARGWVEPDDGGEYLGFRCVREVIP